MSEGVWRDWRRACQGETGCPEVTTLQFRKIASRCRSALEAVARRPAVLFMASASGLVLTPVAVLAAVLGAWRLGADPGWTSRFFIADGLLSRYQMWFAAAIGAQASASILKRRAANRNRALPPGPLFYAA